MRLPSTIMKFSSPLFLASLTCSISLIQAKALWASTPSSADVLAQAYPVGNGRLGGMPFGAPGAEKIVLNIDSLWSGGPFESSVSFPSILQGLFLILCYSHMLAAIQLLKSTNICLGSEKGSSKTALGVCSIATISVTDADCKRC
jgi:hypothetical protein